MDKTSETLAHLLPSFGLDQKYYKAATPRAKELAADGAGLARRLVNFVDDRRRDALGQFALQTPAFMKQLAE